MTKFSTSTAAEPQGIRQMPKQTLTLNTIGDVDKGALRVAVNQALKLITNDLADRPSLNKNRTVVLKIDMKPVINKNSSTPELEEADVAWQVMSKTPAIGSEGVVMKPQQDGQLYFHSDLPDAPDDETIMDEAERRRSARMNRSERAE
jgi:hypothetical protein